MEPLAGREGAASSCSSEPSPPGRRRCAIAPRSSGRGRLGAKRLGRAGAVRGQLPRQWIGRLRAAPPPLAPLIGASGRPGGAGRIRRPAARTPGALPATATRFGVARPCRPAPSAAQRQARRRPGPGTHPRPLPLVDQIGEGGMAEVFTAVSAGAGVPAAVRHQAAASAELDGNPSGRTSSSTRPSSGSRWCTRTSCRCSTSAGRRAATSSPRSTSSAATSSRVAAPPARAAASRC